MAKKDVLAEICAPVVEGMGFQFWGLDYISAGKHSTLRVFIDHEDGITVDNCADVSRQLSGVMDVEDPISQEYVLEVSSPGMDRPLYHEEQYKAYINHLVELRLNVPYEGRRKYKGQLLSVENNEIGIYVDGHEVILPIEMIDRANVVPTFEK